jgi:hypothetical protein
MGFLAPAAPTVLPMLIGAGAGAMLDKNNPMRGALLGAVGGHALAPAVTALGGIGTAGMGAEAALAANPAMIMGAEAAGGLPSMASVASTMPGGMAAPGAIGANGVGFGANALTAANAYNAMPVMDRLGALVHAPTKEGLLKSAGRMVMGQEQQQPQPMPMAPPPMPPRPTQAGPMPQVNRFVTGMPSMARRKDPREEMWGYS